MSLQPNIVFSFNRKQIYAIRETNVQALGATFVIVEYNGLSEIDCRTHL